MTTLFRGFLPSVEMTTFFAGWTEMTTICGVCQWFASYAKGAAEGVARVGAVPGAASDAGDKGR